MQTVPQSAVEDAWHELYSTSEPHAQELVDQFAREQPALAEFLTAAEEDIDRIDDRGFLMMYGVWTWLAFKKNGRDVNAVSAATVEGARERNLADTQWLEGTSDRRFLDAAQDFVQQYRQWPMFSALIADIMQGRMEAEQSADDITGMLLVYAKTVVDCLDA